MYIWRVYMSYSLASHKKSYDKPRQHIQVVVLEFTENWKQLSY